MKNIDIEMEDCIVKARAFMDTVHQRRMCLTFRHASKLNYLRNRLLSLYPRFVKFTNVYPSYFRNDTSLKHIESLCRGLGSGRSMDVLVLSNQELNDDVIFEPLLESSTTAPVSAEALVVCVALIDKLDQHGLEVTLKLVTSSMSLHNVVHDCYIICITNEVLSQKETARFREDLTDSIPSRKIDSIKPCFISSTQILSTQIASMYENRVTDAMVEMYMYVQFYVRNEYIEYRSMEIVDSKYVHAIVKEHLQNIYTVTCADCDYPNSEILLERLARIVRCAVVPSAAIKHALPPSLINSILCDMKFDETLPNKLSKQTRHWLTRRFINARKHVKTKDNSQRSTFINKRGLHTETLLQDVKNVFKGIEKKIDSIRDFTAMFRKLMMEIRGHLKQTDVKHLIVATDLIAESVPVNLRNNILLTKGVYAVGTTYGQLEIHLDISTEDERTKKHVCELLRRYRYGNGTKLKYVEKIPN